MLGMERRRIPWSVTKQCVYLAMIFFAGITTFRNWIQFCEGPALKLTVKIKSASAAERSQIYKQRLLFIVV